jgi:hypothetical protein
MSNYMSDVEQEAYERGQEAAWDDIKPTAETIVESIEDFIRDDLYTLDKTAIEVELLGLIDGIKEQFDL